MGVTPSAERKPTKVTILGLSGAGKTTFLYRAKLGSSVERAQIFPTDGFNIETISIQGTPILVAEYGGKSGMLRLHPHHLPTQALIYMVDSSDRDVLRNSVLELNELLQRRDGLQKVPTLVLCNKQDLPGAMSVDDIASSFQHELNIDSRAGSPWHVLGCSAATGQGVIETLDWAQSTGSKSF